MTTKKLSPRYARTIVLLQRKNGATLDQLVAEFGVLRHTARAMITIATQRAGVTVIRDKETGRYRVAS